MAFRSLILLICFLCVGSAQAQLVDSYVIVDRIKLRETTIDLREEGKESQNIENKWVQLKTASQYFYTTSYFGDENITKNQVNDGSILSNMAEFAVAPNFIAIDGHALLPKIGYRHRWVNFGVENDNSSFIRNGFEDTRGLNSLDFDVQTVFGSLAYEIDKDFILFGSVEWNRYLGHENTSKDYDQFYSEIRSEIGIQKQFNIGDFGSLYIAGAYNCIYTEMTEPAVFIRSQQLDRMESTVDLGWRYSPVKSFTINPYYQFKQSHYYVTRSRNDFIQTAGLNLAWRILPQVELEWFGAYQKFDAGARLADPEFFDLGGGLSLKIGL